MPTASSNLSTEPKDRLIALALAGAVLVVGAWWIVGGVCGVYHDDAIYVITAKALADGEGYRLVHLPDQPIQTKYPILLPAVLAVVWLLWPAFPDNLIAMQGVCLLSGALAVALGYLYTVRYRYFSRCVAAAAALLCATAPLFVYYGSLTLSEMPFALLLIVVCWRMDAALAKAPAGSLLKKGDWLRARFVFSDVLRCREVPVPLFQQAASPLRQFGLGVLITLPFWCRTVGAALIPAAILLLHRRGHPKRFVVAGTFLSLLPWALWMLVGVAARNADPVDGYYTDYVSWWSSLGLPLLVRVFTTNAGIIVWDSAGLGLAGINQILVDAGITPTLLMILLGLFGWIPMLRQCYRGQVLPSMLTAYVLLVALWPWPPGRFMVTILPWLVAYLLAGLSRLATLRLQPAVWRRVALAGFCFALAANVALLYRYRDLSHQTGFPQNRLAKQPVRWESYQRLFGWLQVNTPAETVVATEMDPMFYLYAGRRGYRPFVSRPGAMFYGTDEPLIGTTEELVGALRAHHPDYVALTPMQFFDEPFVRLVEELQHRHPGWLEPAYQDPGDARFSILRVRWDKAPDHAFASQAAPPNQQLN